MVEKIRTTASSAQEKVGESVGNLFHTWQQQNTPHSQEIIVTAIGKKFVNVLAAS